MEQLTRRITYKKKLLGMKLPAQQRCIQVYGIPTAALRPMDCMVLQIYLYQKACCHSKTHLPQVLYALSMKPCNASLNAINVNLEATPRTRIKELDLSGIQVRCGWSGFFERPLSSEAVVHPNLLAQQEISQPQEQQYNQSLVKR